MNKNNFLDCERCNISEKEKHVMTYYFSYTAECCEKCERIIEKLMKNYFNEIVHQPERSKREDLDCDIPRVFNCCWVDVLTARHKNDETCDEYKFKMRCSELQRKPGEAS